MGKRFRSRDLMCSECHSNLMKILLQIKCLLSLVRISPSNWDEDQKIQIKKGLYQNLLLTLAVILDLSELAAHFLAKCLGRILLVRRGLNLDGGTLHFDGGRVPLQFKYCL